MKGQPDLFLSIAKICEQRLNLPGCDLAEAMSDAVWLSTRLAIEGVDCSEDTVIDEPVDDNKFDGDEEPTSSADSDENNPVEPATGEQENPELMPSTSGDSAAYVEFESSGAPIPGRRIMFPGVPPLQGARAFERAWRPFAKRIPDAHRMQFDEQATADQIAATLGKVWSIASKPSMNRRWQGIAIFERSPTMRFWHHTLEAFYKTMWQTSAFERLQPAYVDAFGQQPAIYKNPSLTSKVDIRSITNETDNEWLFFFTDFRSNAWLNGSMLELIEDWQATTNVVLVHMMQESQWLQSALMQFELTEAKFLFSRSGKNKGSILLFSFEPQSLGNWVGWVMGESGANTSMLSLIPKRPFPDTVPRQDRSAIDSKERVDYLYKRFIQFASEPAQMLARSFASAPLLLPVMRLIQRYEVPDSTSSHLSEILYSGLIKRVRNDEFSEHSKEKSVDPNTIEYDFLPGVRDKLLNNSSLSRIDRVLHLNWEYMQSKYGNGINFNAIIADPSQADSITSYPIANELAPFAKVGGRILQRMGGKQAEAGSSLLARLNPSEAKVVYRPKETEAERLNREYETLKVEFEDGTNVPKGTKFEQPRPKLFELYNPSVLRSSRVLREAIRSAGVQLVELLEQGKIVSGSMHQEIIPSPPRQERLNLWRQRGGVADRIVEGLSFDFEKLNEDNGTELYSNYSFLDDQGMRISNSSNQNFALLLGFKRMYFLSGSNSTNSRTSADDVREFQAIVEKISTAWMALFIQNANRIMQFQRYALRHSALSKTSTWFDALFELGTRQDLAFPFDRFVIVNPDDSFGERVNLVGDGLFPRLPTSLPKEIVAKIPHQLGYPIVSQYYIPDMVAASVTAINYLLGEDLQEQRRRQLVLSEETESFVAKGGDAHFEVKAVPVDARFIRFEDGTNVRKGSAFRESVTPISRGNWYFPSKPERSRDTKNEWQDVLSRLEKLRSENIQLSCHLLHENIPQIGELEFTSIREKNTQAIRICSGLSREFCQLIQTGKERLISDYAFKDVNMQPIVNAVGEADSFRLGFARQFFVYQQTELEGRKAYEITQQIFTAFRKASAELQQIPAGVAKVIWRNWPKGFDSSDFGEDSLWFDALFELAFNQSLKLPFQTERFVGVSSKFDPMGRIQLVGDGLFPRIPTTISEEAFHSIPNQLGYADYFEAELPDLVQASIETIEWILRACEKRISRKRPRVFVHYAEDSEEHIGQVEELVELLVRSGFDAKADLDERSPSIDRLSWMTKQTSLADVVVVVVSERLYEMDLEHRDVGELQRIYPETLVLYSLLESHSKQFVPVVLSTRDRQWIPEPLREFECFLVEPERSLRFGGHEEFVEEIFGKSNQVRDSARSASKLGSQVGQQIDGVAKTADLNTSEVDDIDVSNNKTKQMNHSPDFLIVCPLAEERDAILAQLPTPVLVRPAMEDSNTYFRSSIESETDNGLYQLIILPLSGMGLTNAAAATSNAIKRWNPRYVLVVGIAGGVKKNGVALGDLLISDQIADYELQKIENGKPSIRWQVHRSDNRLLNAAMNHLDNAWQSVKAKRYNSDRSKVHFGPVCTGNKVIADSSLIDQYRDVWAKMIGVEMEGGGVANAVWQSATQPGMLMVRGVSDLADGKKGNNSTRRWRQYACEIAASWTINFLKSGPVPTIKALSSASLTPRTESVPNSEIAMPINPSIPKGLLECLSGLPSSMFMETVFRLETEHGMKQGQVPGPEATQAKQAMALLQVAQSQRLIDKLVDILKDLKVWRPEPERTRRTESQASSVATRNVNVLVVGSYRLENRKAERRAFEKACRELGKELAQNGFTIVACSWRPVTADYHVLSGANETRIGGKAILVFPTESDEADDFEKVVLSNLSCERRYAKGIHIDARPAQIDAADVIIAIGGSTGTQLVMDLAEEYGKTVIPVGTFGGTVLENWDAQANRLFKDNNLDRKRYGVLRDRFDAKLILQLIDELSDLPKPTVPSEETPKAQVDQSKSLSPFEKRFKVALSFPGEHREFVLSVAEELAKELGQDQIFYDEWFEVELLGTGGDLKLTSMYETADLIVPFFSKYYDKPWCQLEWETIRGILLTRRKDDAVIPVHMDDTAIPGWSVVNFGIRRRSRSPQAIGQVILNSQDLRAKRLMRGVKQSDVLTGVELSKTPSQQGLTEELVDYLSEQRRIETNRSAKSEIDRRLEELKAYVPKIPNKSTELEQRRFLQQSFATICDYFKKAGELFEKSNAQINIEFSQPDKERFRCEIYLEGKQITGCQIWIGSDRFDAGIHYFQGRDTTTEFNARNETIVVDSSVGAGSLRLKGILGIWQSEPIDKSDPQSTAAILWKRLVSQLES